MPEELSKVWILEQFEKMRDSLKRDSEIWNNRLSNHVTKEDCAERRSQETKEIVRIDKRMDEFDVTIENTRLEFEKKWDKLDVWVWRLLAGIIGQLAATIIGFVLKYKL